MTARPEAGGTGASERPLFAAGETLDWRPLRFGAEGGVVIVVEDFLADPDALVREAITHASFAPDGRSAYPGVRARLPRAYPELVCARLGGVIASVFGFGDCDVAGGQSDLSLVTTRHEDLGLVQRMPHFDGPDPHVIAGVHYLCPSACGGTSFYRHRSTGFEFVDGPRRNAFIDAVKGDIARHGPPPPRHMNGDDALFERIASVEAVYNRLILYRGMTLHAGDIGPDFAFEADPAKGRLTVNTFLMFRPRT